jgi:DNA-binding transcriptional LysR family regulator
MQGAKAGILRVGTFSSIALGRLPGILEAFRWQYPGIEVLVQNGTYSYVEQALLERAVDCAFVTMPSREEFSTTSLLCDRLLVVMNRGNGLAQRSTLLPEDLVSQEYIVPAEGAGYDIDKMFARAGISPKTRLAINDDYTAVEMVRKRHGITILPELLVNSLSLGNLLAIPIANSQRRIGIAVLKKGYSSPATKAFLQFLTTVMAD